MKQVNYVGKTFRAHYIMDRKEVVIVTKDSDNKMRTVSVPIDELKEFFQFIDEVKSK